MTNGLMFSSILNNMRHGLRPRSSHQGTSSEETSFIETFLNRKSNSGTITSFNFQALSLKERGESEHRRELNIENFNLDIFSVTKVRKSVEYFFDKWFSKRGWGATATFETV